jgi:hypothetical protein
MTHYLISIFAGIICFFLGYELLQEFVTRNLPDDPALQLATRFILNLYFAGFLSGAVYAATFKRGYLPIATIPATLFGGLFLVVAIIRGEIGMGLEYTTSLSAWQFAIPVVIGVASSYISAKIMRRFLTPR